MAILAVPVVGVLQFHSIPLFFSRIMAFAAFLYLVALFPHVLAVLVHMVALGAG